jgi:sulfur carrier protein ThiS
MAKEFDLFTYLLAKQNAGSNTEEILAELLTLTTPSEETVEAALTQLGIDKSDLVAILNAKGVTASDTETFTELVPKVLDISGGGGAYDGVAVIPIQSIAEALPTNTTVTV